MPRTIVGFVELRVFRDPEASFPRSRVLLQTYTLYLQLTKRKKKKKSTHQILFTYVRSLSCRRCMFCTYPHELVDSLPPSTHCLPSCFVCIFLFPCYGCAAFVRPHFARFASPPFTHHSCKQTGTTKVRFHRTAADGPLSVVLALHSKEFGIGTKKEKESAPSSETDLFHWPLIFA